MSGSFTDSQQFMQSLEAAGLKQIPPPPPPPPDGVPHFSAQGVAVPTINLHVEKNDYMYWELPGDPLSEQICKFSPEVIALLNEIDPENAHKIYHFSALGTETHEDFVAEGYGFCVINDDRTALVDLPDTELSNALEAFSGKRVLLLIHGTGSEVKAAFNPMESLLTDLSAQYEERILGFNHPSLPQTPRQNAEAFLKSVNTIMTVRNLEPIEFDLIAHSRGGILSREIQRQIEVSDTLKDKLSIRKILMVATPNAGTAYLDYSNISNSLAYLNVLTQIQRYTLGVTNPLFGTHFGLLARWAKRLALNKHESLPGLDCMVVPENSILKELNEFAAKNDSIQKTFYAIGSNYEGKGNPLAEDGCEMNLRIARVLDPIVIDNVIFKGKKNDLVVPTRGTYTSEGTSVPGFQVPKGQYVVYQTRGDLVDEHHKLSEQPLYHNACNLFRDSLVRQQISDFLAQ